MFRHASCPDQTVITAAPVTSGSCTSHQCLSVSADSPAVTAGALRHMDNLSRLDNLRLSGLRTGLINDTLLYNLHNHSGLEVLHLGHYDSPPETGFSVSAVIRSVGGGLAIHTHTDSYTRPDADIQGVP